MGFDEIDRTNLAEVGGKGANLGELSRVDGIRVPDGFCVTTGVFQRVVVESAAVNGRLDLLSRVDPDDLAAVRTLSTEIRGVIEGITMPDDVVAAIGDRLVRLGEHLACAVRSSATAEDLPTASFAGQQDSYLNIVGLAEVLRHVRRCWASTFTDRAVAYRRHHGFDHRCVRMGVVVQRMVFPETAGTLFTADPLTSNRKVATVEAGWGLGQALVSGLVNGDVYSVRDDQVVTATVARKPRAVHPVPGGGTRETPVESARQARRTLTEEQVVRLARLGRRIEAHFGVPQDIEWCQVGHDFHIVQSRPITTLFPVPATDDQDNHVYVSVGHQQMMTDAMMPLGLSLWQLTTPAPMYEAGGRLFVDVAPALATPTGRARVLGSLGASDPLILDALQTILDRGDFIGSRPDDGGAGADVGLPSSVDIDPAVVTELIKHNRASVADLRREARSWSGPELIDRILADVAELTRILFDPRSIQVIVAAVEATSWINNHIESWLGEQNAADALLQSVPDNITSEMGLRLLDVADTIRPHQEVVSFLQQVADGGHPDSFLDELVGLTGGDQARACIQDYLDDYGMRCAGEIDITRTRWSENPAVLVPTILGNIRNFEPGAGKRRFAQGRDESRRKERELLTRLRALPDGERQAEQTKRMIDRVRALTGYREYPKYGMVCRYFVYKQALLREAERLVRAGTLCAKEDIYYLRLQELREVIRTNTVDDTLIQTRRETFRTHQALTPPRVLTSDGEVITGEYRRGDAPPGALAGLPVSAGSVEGRARVVVDMTQADLQAGDILVTAYTDPSWTPLFLTVDGLVTEVGGLMTHGAVIAREYGLPAVVGVEGATRRIRDGQRIRVDGTNGYVHILT